MKTGKQSAANDKFSKTSDVSASQTIQNNITDPRAVISSIESQLESTPVWTDSREKVTLTISAGYSPIRHNVTNPLEECIHNADMEMYNNKVKMHMQRS